MNVCVIRMGSPIEYGNYLIASFLYLLDAKVGNFLVTHKPFYKIVYGLTFFRRLTKVKRIWSVDQENVSLHRLLVIAH